MDSAFSRDEDSLKRNSTHTVALVLRGQIESCISGEVLRSQLAGVDLIASHLQMTVSNHMSQVIGVTLASAPRVKPTGCMEMREGNRCGWVRGYCRYSPGKGGPAVFMLV